MKTVTVINLPTAASSPVQQQPRRGYPRGVVSLQEARYRRAQRSMDAERAAAERQRKMTACLRALVARSMIAAGNPERPKLLGLLVQFEDERGEWVLNLGTYEDLQHAISGASQMLECLDGLRP
jgi:hypothetical protein